MSPAAPDSILIPLYSLGLGTGTAAVLDARSGRPVRLCDPPTVLLGDAVCVRAERVAEADGLLLVRLPGGVPAWVRPLDGTPGRAA